MVSKAHHGSEIPLSEMIERRRNEVKREVQFLDCLFESWYSGRHLIDLSSEAFCWFVIKSAGGVGVMDTHPGRCTCPGIDRNPANGVIPVLLLICSRFPRVNTAHEW
ncbi:MAG: hypothetical protein HQL90_01620 [Magnetococcales bacterium]|nr:hypothetical protein [Magnetococcales bacterium]